MAERAASVITIRPARIEDAEAIHGALLGIAETVGELHKVTSTADDIRRYGFGAHSAFEVLIAETDSEFAGMCLYFPIFSSWMGRPGVYIQDLFVAERFRSLKIGEHLLRRVAKLSKDAGGVYLRLSVDTQNVRAQAFYERLGIRFVPDEQVHKILGEAFFHFADGDSPY